MNFKYENRFDWDALSGEVKINLYRIIQESIQNSIKHAACKTIDINLMVDDAGITMIIVDDGRGFKVKKNRKGIGMRNISSRVKKLKGNWKVNSQLGKGTEIVLDIPYNGDFTREKINVNKNLQKI